MVLVRAVIAQECAAVVMTPAMLLSDDASPALTAVRARVVWRLRKRLTLPSAVDTAWALLRACRISGSLLAAECERVTVTPAMVLSGDRRKAVAWVRARVMRRLYAMGRFSLPGIGQALGRDHTTVIHALRRPMTPDCPALRPRAKPLPLPSRPVDNSRGREISPKTVRQAPKRVVLPSQFAPSRARMMGAR